MFKDMISQYFSHIYIITGYTDMRNGIAGLAAMVRLRFNKDTLEEGTIFLFCGRNCRKMKALFWDGNGYCLLSRALSRGSFQWPRTETEARALTRQEFCYLMEGFSIESHIPGNRLG